MANTIVEYFAPTGLTLALKLFPHGSDVQANSPDDTFAEPTNRKGIYHATVTEALAGMHTAHIYIGASVFDVQGVYLQDDTGIYPCYYLLALDPSAITAAAANKIADHVRRRQQANVEQSTDGDALAVSSEYGTIQQMQEANTQDNPGELTVYKTDGTTEIGRKTVTTSAGAQPIVGVQ